jgi:hypothetical protein
MKLRNKVILSYVLAGFYALALLPWPFTIFLAAFGFDDPSLGRAGLLATYYVCYSIVLYPVYWAAGLYLGRGAAKRNQPTWLVLLKGSIPLLSGMWFVAIPFLVHSEWHYVQSEHPNRHIGPPDVYYLGDQQFAVENDRNYFLNPALAPRPGGAVSAWIVDLKRDRPDKDHCIYLGPNNLDREFFRDHDRGQLEKVPGTGIGSIFGIAPPPLSDEAKNTRSALTGTDRAV